MPTKKENYKMLRTLANNMPAMQETYTYNLVMDGARLKDAYAKAGKEHADINPKKKYKVTMPANRKVDHYRYLRRIFDQSGTQGVLKYINEVEAKIIADGEKIGSQ